MNKKHYDIAELKKNKRHETINVHISSCRLTKQKKDGSCTYTNCYFKFNIIESFEKSKKKKKIGRIKPNLIIRKHYPDVICIHTNIYKNTPYMLQFIDFSEDRLHMYAKYIRSYFGG